MRYLEFMNITKYLLQQISSKSVCYYSQEYQSMITRVVNGPTRSGPNLAQTRKCKSEPENDLKLQMSPKKNEQLYANFCSIE